MIVLNEDKINGKFKQEDLDFRYQSYYDDLFDMSKEAESIGDIESSELLNRQSEQWGWQMDLLSRVKEVNGVYRFKSKSEYLEELKRLHKALDEYPRDSQCVLDEIKFMDLVSSETYEDKEYINFTTLDDEYKFS